jgi:hypothetical protein
MKIAGVFLFLAGSLAMAGDLQLGKPLTLSASIPLAEILTNPSKYIGKTVQVTGKVTEVCEMMGCWMNLADPANQSIRVKANDGEIVFPKTAVGKTAVVEGTLTKLELTKEQAIARARHEAEEQGRKFRPDTIKSGTTIYQLQGTGAVIR